MLALAAKYQLAVPQGLRWWPDRWNGVAVLEGPEAKLSVDLSIPTDKQLTAQRPDLVAYLCKEKVIVIFRVACAWEPLVSERELEKFSKYRDLAADLASLDRPFGKLQQHIDKLCCYFELDSTELYQYLESIVSYKCGNHECKNCTWSTLVCVAIALTM